MDRLKNKEFKLSSNVGKSDIRITIKKTSWELIIFIRIKKKKKSWNMRNWDVKIIV